MFWSVRGERLRLSLTVLFTFLLYSVYTVQRDQLYINDTTLKCKQEDIDIKNLVQLTYEVHKILDDLKIDHWLMYGSVFGALRSSGPLPWDYDVDIGMRGEQFDKIGIQKLTHIFKANGIHRCLANSRFLRSGVATLCKPGWKLDVDLYVLYDYGGIMKRYGWDTWLRYVYYEVHHTFPAKLVQNPLPKVKFGFFNMTVPHGGNKITKYLYRFDWWKEMKPLGC